MLEKKNSEKELLRYIFIYFYFNIKLNKILFIIFLYLLNIIFLFTD